jgi:hypothetical protein
MIIAYGEDGMFTVHADLAEVRREWEPIDVENGVAVFYAEDGTWLKPEFTKPNRRGIFGSISQGEYTLTRCEQRDAHVDPIEVALDEAAGIEPNPYFDSLDSIRRHLELRPGTGRADSST